MSRLAVSVIIPTYNRAALVTRAVRSVLAAACPGDEVLVVDDGSTDGTEGALAPYRSVIQYRRLGHAGAGAARNYGLSQARNPLVAFLDSDDEWMADKLLLQRALLERRPDVVFCFSDFGVRMDNGEEHRRCLINWHNDPRPWAEILGPGVRFSSLGKLPAGRDDLHVHIGDLYDAEMEANYIAAFTLVVRREAAGSDFRFPEDLPTYEDWECFGRLTRAGAAAYLDCETAWNWGHRGPRLTDADAYVRATTRLKILSRVWGTDEAFQARCGDRFQEVVAAQHLLRAQCLVHRGRTSEARTELSLAGGGPLSYRALAALPGPVARGLLAVRRAVSRDH